MRLRNCYTATLGLPGGTQIEPGAEADVDAKVLEHGVVKVWVEAGLLVPIEAPKAAPAPEVEAPAAETKRGKKG